MSVVFGANAGGHAVVANNRAINGLDPVTVTVWGYARSAGGGVLGRYFSKESNGVSHDLRLFRSNYNAPATNRVTCGMSRNGVYDNDASPATAAPLALNTWHQVGAIVQTNASACRQRIAVSGVVIADTDGTTALAAAHSLAHPLYIGNRSGFDRVFDGMLAHVAIWNRALTAAELLAQYQRGPLAVPRGLVGYWPLDTRQRGGPSVNLAPVPFATQVRIVSPDGFGPDPYEHRYVGAPQIRRTFPLFRTLRPSLDLSNSGWVTP